MYGNRQKICWLESEMLVLEETTPADNIMAENIPGIHNHLRRRASKASDGYTAAKTFYSTNTTNNGLATIEN